MHLCHMIKEKFKHRKFEGLSLVGIALKQVCIIYQQIQRMYKNTNTHARTSTLQRSDLYSQWNFVRWYIETEENQSTIRNIASSVMAVIYNSHTVWTCITCDHDLCDDMQFSVPSRTGERGILGSHTPVGPEGTEIPPALWPPRASTRNYVHTCHAKSLPGHRPHTSVRQRRSGIAPYRPVSGSHGIPPVAWPWGEGPSSPLQSVSEGCLAKG